MQSRIRHLGYQLPVDQFEALPLEEARSLQGATICPCEPSTGTGGKLRGMNFNYSRHSFFSHTRVQARRVRRTRSALRARGRWRRGLDVAGVSIWRRRGGRLHRPWDDSEGEAGAIGAAAEDALGGILEILLEGYELLRVAVCEREPGALHLDDDGVDLAERVVGVGNSEGDEDCCWHGGGVAVADSAGFVSVSEFGGGFADLGGNVIGVGGDSVGTGGAACADEWDGGVAGGVRERNGKGGSCLPPVSGAHSAVGALLIRQKTGK